jgi:hypothetical protein
VSLWVCLDCTTAFSVGAPRCPNCRSERHAEEHEAAALGIQHGAPIGTEEDDMPKITRLGGASVAGEEPEADEGGEDVSAGTSSETSSEKPSTKPETSGAAPPKRARRTASRSGKGQSGTPDSSAGSADGGPEDGTSETDGSDA